MSSILKTTQRSTLSAIVILIAVLIPYQAFSENAVLGGDVDGNGVVDLGDVILALQIITEVNAQSSPIFKEADINGDERIGAEEAFYGIQIVAKFRQHPVDSIPDIIISEFLASNAQGLEDEDGDTSDWIELYNPGEAAVNLGGWVLIGESDTRWTFPDITIGPGEYLVVFASGKDLTPSPATVVEGVSNLHTNFQLSQNGEYLALQDPDGVIHPLNLFGPAYPGQMTDMSYGRYEGGEGFRYFAAPTPGGTNEGGNVYEGIIADTVFSVDRGFYTNPFQVAITTETDRATIRYTLDGSTPTANHGTVHSGPLQIAKTAVLRAAAFRSGWRPTNVDTQTYIFVADVAQSPDGQAPGPGWPTGTFSGQVFDYGMDPDVVDDPRYADLMDDALLSVPSISLVTDLPNLFDSETGIYVNAQQDGDMWERPASMELINPDGSDGFQIDAGLRIRGGYSRGGFNPKHAFRLFFRSEYGDGKLRYPLFGDEGADRFDKIDLRTTMNYAWTINFSSHLCTMNRDVFNRDTQRDMGQPYTRSRYYHLYLNGVYWGLFQTQERSEARYAETYFGGDKDDYDVVKVDSGPGRPYTIMPTDGNLDAWHRLWDEANAGFDSDESYYRVQGLNPDGTPNPAYEVLLDVDNLIDYMIIIFYGGNLDSPISRFISNSSPNNFYAIYNRNNPSGFKSFIHDAEHTMLLGDLWGYGNELYTDRTGPFSAGNQRSRSNPQWLHQQLVANPEYRMRFADRAHRYFFNGGLLTPEVTTARLLSRKSEIDLAIIAESARWGDAMPTLGARPRTKDEDWLPAINGIVDTWFPLRTGIVLDQLRNKGWYPNVDAPVFNVNGTYQHGGDISAGDVLKMANSDASGTIYYSLDGSDQLLPYPVTNTTLVAEGDAKRIWVPTKDIGAAWRDDAAFDDAAWVSGTGGVGYVVRLTGFEEHISIDVEDDMYGINASCYIRVPFVVSGEDVSTFDTMTLRIRYDDGFVAYINGVQVEKANAPGSLQWYSTATGAVMDTGFRDFSVTGGLSALNAGDNMLAIHGLNSSSTSSDFLISVELVAGRATDLILSGTTHVSARVLKNGKWSALNEATFVSPAVAESLRITEIMYHPQDLPSGNPDAEFIELQNVGAETINLVKTRFTEGIHFTFPNILLGPGDRIIVLKDQAAFAAQHPSVAGTIAGEFTGSLGNDGERIRLEDPAGVTMLDFSYSDGWYPITDGYGFSLTIVDPASADTSVWDRKEGWRPSTFTGGSPGKDDGSILPEPGTIVINEVLSHSHMADPDWIELLNTTDEPVNIGGWYLSDDGDDLMKYEIAAETVIPAGGYIVLYQDTHFGAAFALSENGETVYLSSALSGVLTGYREEEDFGASESNVAFGRYEKSTGAFNFVAMEENTPDAVNAYPKVGPIIISEIMYHPVSADAEYIELYNITGSPVTLQEYDVDETIAWQFTDGIVFTFPLGTTIPAYGYLLVVQDPAGFAAADYTVPDGVTVLGPYDSGKLDNAGERVEISMPGDVDVLVNRQYIRIDRVNYDDDDPWPVEPDGAGSSLTRKQPAEYGNDVVNWKGALPTPGS